MMMAILAYLTIYVSYITKHWRVKKFGTIKVFEETGTINVRVKSLIIE